MGYDIIDDKNPEGRNVKRSGFPDKSEFWGAIVIKKPGLGQAVPPFPWSLPHGGANDFTEVYLKQPLQILNKQILVPSVSISPIATFPNDVSTPDEKVPCYTFLAPLDGHAFVLIKTTGSTKLYDPSFSPDPWDVEDIDPGDSEKITVVKPLGEKAVLPKFFAYFISSVDFMRGFMRFGTDNGSQTLQIIDVPTNISSTEADARMNYLKVRFDINPVTEE
ncbi:MAG: hypothetical protein WA705_12135 [Candidatus Ozemobacteraceae bacterium]